MRKICLLALIFVAIACNNGGTKEYKGYVGIYKTIDNQDCPFVLSIELKNNELGYKIKTALSEFEGKIEIVKNEAEVYLRFLGIPDHDSNVEGQLIDNKIVIQNYGNSMNEYVHFKECDSKYIELSKIDTQK